MILRLNPNAILGPWDQNYAGSMNALKPQPSAPHPSTENSADTGHESRYVGRDHQRHLERTFEWPRLQSRTFS